MKTKQGQIITIYPLNDEDWKTYMIVEVGTNNVFVTPRQIPLDIDKIVSSIFVLVEVDENDELILDEKGYIKLHKKTMNLRDVLSFYCPSKEIKQRINNGQIKINNKVVKNLDVEVSFEYDNVKQVDLPDFLVDSGLDLNQLTMLKNYADLNIMDLFGSPTLDEGLTNINKFKFLSGFILLSLSKKEHYVYTNNDLINNIVYSINVNQEGPGLIKFT